MNPIKMDLPIRLYTDLDSLLPFCQENEIWLTKIDPHRLHTHEVLMLFNNNVSMMHIPSNLVRQHLKEQTSVNEHMMDDVTCLPGSVMLEDRDIVTPSLSHASSMAAVQLTPTKKVIQFECLNDATVFLKGTFQHWQTYWKIKMTKKVLIGHKYREVDYLVPLYTVWNSILEANVPSIPTSSIISKTSLMSHVDKIRKFPTLVISRVQIMSGLNDYRNILHSVLHHNSTVTFTDVCSEIKKSVRTAKIVQLHQLPLKDWTDLTMSVFFERDNRDCTIEPVLTKISHFQRYGPGRHFKFLCNWANGVQTWQKYIHLLPNPCYREYFKRSGWNMEVECQYDLQSHLDDDGEMSDDAKDDVDEYNQLQKTLKQQTLDDDADEREYFGYKPLTKRKKPESSSSTKARKTSIVKQNTGYPMRFFKNSKMRFR